MNPKCCCCFVCLEAYVTKPGDIVVVKQEDGPGLGLTNNPEGKDLVFVNPVYSLSLPDGPKAYVLHERMIFIAYVTGGTELHGLAVELIRWDAGQERQVFLTPRKPLNFGNDRTRVHLYYEKFAPLMLSGPGQYSFRLVCNGTVIGQTELDVRQAT